MADCRAAAKRRIGYAGLLILLAAAALAWYGGAAAHALSYATYTLDELAARADQAFVGTVLGKERGDEEWNDRYTFRVEIPLRGGLEKKDELAADVLQWSDEGVLHKGDTYLIFLERLEDGRYSIAGVHQGFIKLKNGQALSPFYTQEEVDRYLDRYGLKVKTIYERLVPEAGSEAPFYAVRDATSPGILWTAGLVLAGMLIWMFLRARKRKGRG